MSEKERVKIEPDLDFVQDILDNGGESLKKCFQCGTCSVVCNLAPADSPFPRQEMIWAQWGLKDKLLADANVWSCFQCSDCSAYCPRGASPGDVLGAVRKKVIEGLAFPSFMGKAVGDPQYWLWLFLAPAVILFATVLVNIAIQGGAHDLTSGEIVYGNMISHIQMNAVFPTFTGLAALAFLIGINRMWAAGKGESLLDSFPKLNMALVVQAGKEVIGDILSHKDFEECGTNNWRKLAHMMVFYGFIGLLLTTVLAIVVLVFDHYLHIGAFGEYPLNWYHPIKWLGNASAIALIAGSWIMIQNRNDLAEKGDMKSSYFDLFFLYIVFGVGVTGFLAQLMRFVFVDTAHLLAYGTYFVHLCLVFCLLIYSPYSKFAHFVYRTVALIQKRYDELEALHDASLAGKDAEAA